MKINKARMHVLTLILLSSVGTSEGHPVNVHEQITINAVNSAQKCSKGYTNFINTISVPSALLAQVIPTPYGGTVALPLPYVPQSSTSFNLPLLYDSSYLLDQEFQPIYSLQPASIWMKIGSAKEDDPNSYFPPPASNAGGYRSLNHFYDPIHLTGLSDTLPSWIVPKQFIGQDSITWASISNGAGVPITIFGFGIANTSPTNQWSWQNARNYRGIGYVNYPEIAQPNAEVFSNILGEGVSFHAELPWSGTFGWFLNQNTYINSASNSVPPFLDPASSSAHVSN